MKNQTNLRMVLCCFFGLVSAERVTAVSILLNDGRTISSAVSFSNPGGSGTDSDADSPSVAFGAFNSTVTSTIPLGTVGVSGNSSASQNSTLSPTSFSASGRVEIHAGAGSDTGAAGDFHAAASGRSLYSIRFQLLDCYSYDFLGETLRSAPFETMATISLMREGAGSIFTVLNNISSASASGLLSPGIYLLHAEASGDSGILRGGEGINAVAEYSLTMNLTLEPCEVPDGGSTALMASLGFCALVALRCRYWQKA
jgi:hypothetical protein